MTTKKSINIKESHEGRFTAWCKRHGFKGVTRKCIEAGLKAKSASVREQANFARNSRKWKKPKRKTKRQNNGKKLLSRRRRLSARKK